MTKRTKKKSRKTPAKVNKVKRSLADFQRDKTMSARRKTCPVCQLPESVRDELRAARTQKIPRLVMLEWLTEELGYNISNAALDTHGNGKHDLR